MVMPITSYSGSYQPAPDPYVEAAATHPIERGERLGEHRGGPERFAEHQRAEANVGDATRQRRECDHRVETRFSIRRTAVLPDVEEEMIREPHRLESGLAGARAYSTIVSNRSGRSP